MQCNVGSKERYLRFGGGLLAGAIGGLLPRSGLRTFLKLVGTMNIVTAFTRYCPANAILGIDNCDHGSDEQPAGQMQNAEAMSGVGRGGGRPWA